jgi:putative heme-binding domain-containing protein
MYVVDMCRKVVEHPEWVPPALRQRPDLLAGKHHGRIWRIVPETPRKSTPPRLSQATTPELVRLLAHPSAWQRTTAQRLLLERQDPQAEPLLRALVMSSDQPLARVHAAWLLEHRGRLDADLVQALLQHEHARVREHGVRLAERWLTTSEPVRRRVLELAGDPDPRLRFQVALSLGEWDDDRVVAPLARIAVANVDDRWSRLAVASAVPKRAGALLRELLRSEAGLTRHISLDRLQLVQELAALVGSRQDPDEVAAVLESLLGLSMPDAGAWQMAGRRGLAEGLQRRGSQLAAFLAKLPDFRRDVVRRLESLTDQGIATARDPQRPIAERVEAVQMLAHLDWPTAGPVLARLLAMDPVAEVRQAAARSLAVFPQPEATAALVKPWTSLPAAARREAVEALLARPERTLVLLAEMEAGRVPAADLDPLRRVQLHNHRRSDVRERAQRLFAVSATLERKQVVEHYRRALKLAGDVRRGRDVFQKATCASCHRLGEVGVAVGPDLSDTRTKTAEALLIDLLDPNAAIDNNYLGYVVMLKSGKVVTGMLAAETASSLTLRRADGQTDVVLRQDVEPDGVLSSGKSLMPEGLEKDLTVQDVADLLAFVRDWRELPRARP